MSSALPPSLPLTESSLFERGRPDVYSGRDLKYIGMPIGGICAGQLYLGGDGKLSKWDIFNRFYGSSYSKHPDNHERFLNPVTPEFPFEQGFALLVETEAFRLDQSGFPEVWFRGEYPIGQVGYRRAGLPVSVLLEAFSPFIPLDAEESGLPATLLHYTIQNESNQPVEVSLVGWLENAVGLELGIEARKAQRNQIIREPGFTFLESSLPTENQEWKARGDYGTMGLVLLGPAAEIACESVAAGAPATLTDLIAAKETHLIGALGRTLSLAAGESQTVTFAVVWHFPHLGLESIIAVPETGRYYADRFESALAVVRHLATEEKTLSQQTRLWRDTWYDSTLPYWFLDRTFLNTSTLATSTCYRFLNGRFYGFEGVGSCEGTCTHVWHYAQAVARLFPELERSAREMADYSPAAGFQKDGSIQFRGEFPSPSAVDGQAGCILRAYREHQMSGDSQFLVRIWPRVKRSIEYLMSRDSDADGLLDGPQHNTLDADWYGNVAWLSGLYAAALKAGERMAAEMKDDDFETLCRERAEVSSQALLTLFEGDYFINRVDPAHLDAVNSGTGCEIDQVLGQHWAHQVGLDRILPVKETRRALQSLWEHNFITDAAAFRAIHLPGRWFAGEGDAGLVMCTFPRPDWTYAQSGGQGPDWAAGYFNECMPGFEYQAAAHLLWEGMLPEAMAITRAVHDRHHPAKRNPWNEIESGDHYARSMASYGILLAACGYECHGPSGHLGFDPRLSPEDFRAAFTAPEGWGTFSQKRDDESLRVRLEVKWGKVRLQTFSLKFPAETAQESLRVTLSGKPVTASHSWNEGQICIQFSPEIEVGTGGVLEIKLDEARSQRSS